MIAVSEQDVLRSLCRDSLYDTVVELWDVLIAEEYHANWHIDLICREVQTTLERVFKGLPKEYDLIVNVPPGMTKSTTISVVAPVWAWGRMPSFRSICGSYTGMLANDLGRKSRDTVESEQYTEIFPGNALRKDQNAKSYFMNGAGGMRISVGTGASIVGFHAHAIFIDDPIDPRASLSAVEIEGANTWMNESISTRKVDKRITPTILVMQRLAQNDPTGNMIDQKGKVRHIALPADLNDGYPVIPEELSELYHPSGLLDPIRLPRSVLDQERIRLGEAGYAGQYGQQPIARTGYMFKVDQLKFDRHAESRGRAVRYWDKAGTAGGGCFTVGLLMIKQDSGWQIRDVVRGQWEAFQREEIIKKVAQMDGKEVAVHLEQEPGSGGKESAQNTVRNLAGYRVKAHPVGQTDGNKIMRAEPLASQVNGGNITICEDPNQPGYILTGPWLSELVEELRYFPASRYKDQVDAAAGAFNELAKKPVVLGAF